MAGVSLALQKMHSDNWAGVDMPISGSLSSTQQYQVTFTTGDSSLAPTDPDYSWYPFRVTLVSTGTSTSSPGNVSTHRIQAVVQLVPRALAAEPEPWADINSYTLYQAVAGVTYMYPPLHVEGPVRLRGRLWLGESPGGSTGYAWSASIRAKYLSDLERMRQAGSADYRPLSGPVSLPHSAQSSGLITEMETSLGVATVDSSSASVARWNFPGSMSSYRLFPGGKLYSVPTCPQSVADTTLGPDPASNPLGLYYRSTYIELGNNATVDGTLVCANDIHLSGANVQVNPVSLPPLYGSTDSIRLPILVSSDDIRVRESCRVTGSGLIAAWDDFEVHLGSSQVEFDFEGRVVAKDFEFFERNVYPNWDISAGDWETLYAWYKLNLLAATPISTFPEYLGVFGRDPAPKIQIRSPQSPVQYHWLTDGASVYAPHADDGGLRWDLLDWQDGV
jgi:hypothetical protein